MSEAVEISMRWDLRALALSLVMIMGGLGLFLEPAGRPRGRREEELDNSLLSAAVVGFSSSRSLLDPPVAPPLWSSSELWWWNNPWWRWRSLERKGGGRGRLWGVIPSMWEFKISNEIKEIFFFLCVILLLS